MTISENKQDSQERVARNSLSREIILNSTKKIADSQRSIPSIRQLSNSLGCSSMAIYKHFKDKKALESALLDEILREVSLSSSKRNWEGKLLDFAHSHHGALKKHPWAIPLLYSNPAPGVNSLAIGEHVLGILMNGGIKGEKAIALFSTVIAFNYGWVSFEISKPKNFARDYGKLISPSNLTSERQFPVTRGLASLMIDFGSSKQYELALSSLLLGWK